MVSPGNRRSAPFSSTLSVDAMSTRPIIVRSDRKPLSCIGAGQETSKALRVVGYYADWTAARYPLAEIPAEKLTHVNYAFGKIVFGQPVRWNASAAVEHVIR